MADDALEDGAEAAGPVACLLQRAFAKDGASLAQQAAAFETLSYRTRALDSNVLLAGSAPWEVRGGSAESIHPDGAAHHEAGLLLRIASVPHMVQIAILVGLVIAMVAYWKCGRTRRAEQASKAQGPGVYFHVAVICLAGFLRGYGLYVIGPYLTPVQRSLQFCYPCTGGESDLALAACSCPRKEFAVSSVPLGAIIGAIVGGSMADSVGRRATILVTDVMFIVSSLIMAMSGPGAWASLFFIGRILQGLAIGASGPASHAYISEVAPAKYRGQLLTLNELALCAGCFVVFAFSGIFGDERWRSIFEFPLIPAVLQLVFTGLFLHESPRWLAANGKADEAKDVAESLGLEPNFVESTQHIVRASAQDDENARMVAALGFESKKMPPIHTMTPMPNKLQRSSLATLVQHRRRVLLALGCAVAHNALGANIVMYYSRDILQLANIANSAGSQIGLGAAKTIGTGIAIVAVDRCGRRLLLIVGVVGCILGHLGLAWAFMPGAVEYGGMLAWASLLLFLTAWDLGWASLFAVVISEVLPDDVRGIGLGASCSLYWLISFVQAQTLESLFKQITIAGTFGMYCIASVLGLVFVLMCVPETCGRPLETE